MFFQLKKKFINWLYLYLPLQVYQIITNGVMFIV
jgi:hypothetical protein